MSGGNDDNARNKLGAERILGFVVTVVGCATQAINLLKKYSTLEDKRNMNDHIKRKDFLDYQMAKQAAEEAAKQAADKPVS